MGASYYEDIQKKTLAECSRQGSPTPRGKDDRGSNGAFRRLSGAIEQEGREMSFYIGRSGTGRLVVVDQIPQDYVAGPFTTHNDAFEWMEEQQLKQLKRGDSMKTFWLLAAGIVMAAAAGAAMAGGKHDDGSNSSHSDSSAVARAFGVGVAGSVSEGGSATAQGGSAVAAGGNSSATGGTGGTSSAQGGQGVGSVSYQEVKQFRNAPWVNPPAIQSSNPCATGWSAGLSVPGGGIGGGRVKEDAECNLRETARLAYSFGAGAYALALLCTSKAAEASGVPCPVSPDGEIATQTYVDDRLAAGLVQVREDVLTERNAVCDEKIKRCEAEVRK